MAYNMVFVVTAVMLLMTAPALAAHTDNFGGRKAFLNIATVGTILSYTAAALFAIYGGPIIAAFLFFLLGQYFYQMLFIFYEPLINDLSDESHRARASGFGQFCNSIGMITGLAISLPMVEAGGRLASLLPAVGLFALFALPMMVLYREGRLVAGDLRAPVLSGARRAPATNGRRLPRPKLGFDWKRFKHFMLNSTATPVLLAIFFYANALNTITNNYSIYADKVLSMSDEMTTLILIVVQIAAALGALGIGFIGDRLGVRRCLSGILWIWALLIPTISLVSALPVFYILAGILGATIGAGWTIARAYVSTCLDKDSVGYGFSFYTIFERFSSIIGPLAWGGIIMMGGGHRLAMFSMVGFIIVGMIMLRLKNHVR